MSLRCATLWSLLWIALIARSWGAPNAESESIDTNFRFAPGSTTMFGDLTSAYRINQWKVEQGLPQNQVSALLQSHDGYIWIGTVFGLVRYDGVRFAVFEKSTLPLMEETDDHILSLAEDSDKALWVCTSRGLLRSHDHVWTVFRSGFSAAPDHGPTAVHPHPKGGVWVGSSEHLFHFNADGMVKDYKIPLPGIRSIRMIATDLEHQVWFADRYRVMRWNPGSSPADISVVFSAGTDWVRYLNRDQEGRMCFGGEFGAFRIERGQTVRLIGASRTAKPEPRGDVHAMTTDSKGRVWVAQDGQLKQIRIREGTEPEVMGVVEHPGLTSVDHILSDREGNLWVGTKADGLVFLQERRFATLQPATKGPHNDVWTVCEDQKKNIWFGTSLDLFRWSNGKLTHFRSPLGNQSGLVYSVLPDADGSLWVGYGGKGLFRLKDDEWQEGPYTNPLINYPLNGYNVRSLLKDRDGALWFGVLKGAYRYDGQRLTCFTQKDGLPGGDIRAIAQDRKGVLWFGTITNGLARYVGNEFNRLSRADGLAHNEVTSFCEDSLGNMWIGTASGLTRYKNGELRTLRKPQGMFDNVVNCVILDDLGFFWVSSNRGIFRFPEAEANDVADGVKKAVTSMPFGESDGMATAETNGGSQPAGWKGADGILWFPSAKGLVRIDPRSIQENRGSPDVVLEQVVADRKVIYGDDMGAERGLEPDQGKLSWRERRRESTPLNLKLKAGQGRVLEIRYTANSFEEPSKVLFKYKLVGHDTEWYDARDRRVTHYTNLEPGDYEFQIQACNNHGFWGPTNTTLTFSIAPFFYQTPLFYGLCALSLVGLAAAVQSYRLHVQRRILQLEKEHALEKERARIAKDVHDDLGARLTQLGIISELVESPGFRPTESGARLPKVSSLAQDAVRSLDEIVWAVSPGKNSLDQLVGYIAQFAQDLVAVSGKSFDLEVPNYIPPTPLSTELRHNVFLIAKEALNNAVKHSKAGRVGLKFEILEGCARVTVNDNGLGFIPVVAAGAGNGLSNMEKRAESVGARLILSSEPGRGTIVVIEFPTITET